VIWAFCFFYSKHCSKLPAWIFFCILVLSWFGFSSKDWSRKRIYRFNSDTGFQYSEMNGYGSEVGIYYLYKGMWFLLGLALSGMTLCSGLEEWDSRQ
jgi:ABC-2 type transport system permease protein